MSSFNPQSVKEWVERAAEKDAVVPRYWVTYPHKVDVTCGSCGAVFSRNLVPNVNDPTFICPEKDCRTRNWIPLTYAKGFKPTR